MNFVQRDLQVSIEQRLFQGKVVILYGARQVGKTTLAKKILEEYGDAGRYFNCEVASVRRVLESIEPERIRAFFGETRIVVLDEAQKVPHIGQILKVMVDAYPDLQIIATGSSSFDLADRVSEPLTGRNFTFTLFPLSIREISAGRGISVLESRLEQLLRFGSYPEVFSLSDERAKERLDEIASDYLYKDVLAFERMKKSEVIRNLLELLALQLGQEVSYQELAQQLGINRVTVQKYIDILEKSFVVFRLRAFSRNQRKEISKSVKVYFVDLGLRNSIIQNYNPLELRSDRGALWENFCIGERRKMNERNRHPAHTYFWRTYSQKEVDYVEESSGEIRGYEFKWNTEKNYVPPTEFVDAYRAVVEKVDPSNYWKFIELG
jgi:predicted AAA+ superfamily ATPase